MSGFWQGVFCAYILIGAAITAIGMPDGWRSYRRRNPKGSVTAFVLIAFSFPIFWIVPAIQVWRERG